MELVRCPNPNPNPNLNLNPNPNPNPSPSPNPNPNPNPRPRRRDVSRLEIGLPAETLLELVGEGLRHEGGRRGAAHLVRVRVRTCPASPM